MASGTSQVHPPPTSSESDGIQNRYRQERRAHRRFPVHLEFELFHFCGASHLLWAGSGRTANWSRDSILIPWDKQLSIGSSVELVVRWSSLTQLVILGRVIKVETRGVVVKIMRWHFRGGKESDGALPRHGPVRPAVPPLGHARAS